MFHRPGPRPDSHQSVERRPVVPPLVPTEHKLVEVGLNVFLAEAVVDPARQPLDVREHPVDPRQQHVGGYPCPHHWDRGPGAAATE